MTAEEKACEVVGSGWIFPITQFEIDLPDGVRVIIYAMLLGYLFLGVAIISDIFMSSIDAITSRRSKVMTPYRLRMPKVWNDTVATLSLMALGSSAPEIFLSVVEIFKKRFYIGGLGTSTIVGSAAFNLLVIIAVCIVAIPEGEGRLIQDLPAFYITAMFSMFAYLWLGFIVQVNSPNVVDWWEALLTLLFLPMLISTSYAADMGGLERLGFCKKREAEPEPSDKTDEAPNRIRFKMQNGHDVDGQYIFPQSTRSQVVNITVEYDGDTPAICAYRTEAHTAVPTYHYVDTEGTLTFGPGKHETNIQVVTRPGKTEIDRDILIILSDPIGAEFDPEDTGGANDCIACVTLEKQEEDAAEVEKVGEPGMRVSRASRRQDSSMTMVGTLSSKSSFGDLGRMTVRAVETQAGSVNGCMRVLDEWREQLEAAKYCGGSADEQSEASWPDFMLHLVSLPWKVLFSCAPPLYMLQGWGRFAWSIFGIACMTMMISDLAELFGCVLELPDICTALVFVALGTSMPDLFASLSAAKEDETADASIVNVTGSNSVNIFLGLGIPYMIASSYWDTIEGDFIIQTDGLEFSIGCFCCVCLAALILLVARRKLVGSELGGPKVPKFVSGGTFVLFWILFVSMSSWRVLRGKSSAVGSSEVFAAGVFASTTVSLLVLINLAVLWKYRGEYSMSSRDEAAILEAVLRDVVNDDSPRIVDFSSSSSVAGQSNNGTLSNMPTSSSSDLCSGQPAGPVDSAASDGSGREQKRSEEERRRAEAAGAAGAPVLRTQKSRGGWGKTKTMTLPATPTPADSRSSNSPVAQPPSGEFGSSSSDLSMLAKNTGSSASLVSWKSVPAGVNLAKPAKAGDAIGSSQTNGTDAAAGNTAPNRSRSDLSKISGGSDSSSDSQMSYRSSKSDRRSKGTSRSSGSKDRPLQDAPQHLLAALARSTSSFGCDEDGSKAVLERLDKKTKKKKGGKDKKRSDEAPMAPLSRTDMAPGSELVRLGNENQDDEKLLQLSSVENSTTNRHDLQSVHVQGQSSNDVLDLDQKLFRASSQSALPVSQGLTWCDPCRAGDAVGTPVIQL